MLIFAGKEKGATPLHFLLRERNENGFTLMEVVITVAVVLILSIGGFMAYGGFQSKARDAAVESAAQEVYTGAAAHRMNKPDTDLDVLAAQYNTSADGIITTIDEGANDICVSAVIDGAPEHNAQRGDCLTTGGGGDQNGEDNSGDENAGDDENGGDTVIALSPPQNLHCDSPFFGTPALEWLAPDTGAPIAGYVIEVRHVLSGTTNTYIVDDIDTSRIVLTQDNLERLLGETLGLGGNFSVRIASEGPANMTSEFTVPVEFYPGLPGGIPTRCV